jgi:O-Antigen ligase
LARTVATLDAPGPPAAPGLIDVSSRPISVADVVSEQSTYGPPSLPLIVVLSALLFAAWRQGAYYGHQFAVVELVVAAAAAVSVLAGAVRCSRHWLSDSHTRSRSHPTGRRALQAARRWDPLPAVLAATGLGAATAITAAVHHQIHQASSTFGILVAATVVTWLVTACGARARRTFAVGLVMLGMIVAATGWWGVAWHHSPWSLVDGGLWRAASTVTYANATAAVCVPLALLALSRVTERRSAWWSLTAAVLITGSAATMSRAGALAFAAGFAVLVGFHGPGSLLRAAWAPAAGALLATSGLTPSFPAGGGGVVTPGHPVVALVAAVAGLGVAGGGARWLPRSRTAPGDVPSTPGPRSLAETGLSRRRRQRWILLPVLLAALLATVVVATPALRHGRLSLESPDRARAWDATWDLAKGHPLTGIGPGAFAATWVTSGGEVMTSEYTHNEYLQLAAQQGLLGAVAMTLGLGAIAAVAWRRRPHPEYSPAPVDRSAWIGAAAGLTALALHSGFDFLWHIPLIPLVGAALAGMVLARGNKEVLT